LVREWSGELHRIMALEGGFAWNGSTYGSLSEVARAITGVRNGPRFFGLGRRNGANQDPPRTPTRSRRGIGQTAPGKEKRNLVDRPAFPVETGIGDRLMEIAP
jgi:hypothetical protein